MEKKWWKEAVGYQIYPRSFKDSNGDGIGDLNGIREKLPYLKELGVNFIWINPVYDSPNIDNGYDISNYHEILADFGTMADFDLLLKEAHQLDLKIIMDLVINHTSDQHDWFRESAKGKDNPYRDYYIWKDGVDGGPPSDWQAIFGGSVWEYDETTEQYYFHAFAKEQPDLDWENEEVRKELFSMISWWLDKGIDGFRVDAISHIKKAAHDLPAHETKVAARYQNIEGIDSHLNELKEVFDRYDIMTVGEASGVSAHEAEKWAGKDGYFNMIFEFEHIGLWKQEESEEFDIKAFKEALSSWQYALDGKGWNALYMENHDVPRSVSAFGNDSKELREISAKALALVYMLLQGTPFIYQGQELGMTNMPFESIEQVDALDSKYLYHELRKKGKSEEEAMAVIRATSRDNARTPMQWDDTHYGGFSENKPWLSVNPNKSTINAEQEQTETTSVFHFYQQLIQLRKENQALIYGSFEELLPEDEQLYVYLRLLEEDVFLIIVNLSGERAAYKHSKQLEKLGEDWQLVLGNYFETGKLSELSTLQPYEARLYQLKINEKNSN
ncbi:alpha-glucosidase [Enterococcus sp. BWB1-3]|uniref:glycoside hydrolase family 13 protein n=1 Tax=Enterococcus sp. BWB1-3 TaxID=2787713 RepID=UPI0019241C64|nr:alpha-glucosidase [Enterococcus sp. BWB1-3]MBL1230400.1 alpha-glucosidase [Enterococcus sp. BWB1-3]